MKVHVNELLLYGRLPFHYWTEVNGGSWPWDNPGCSVLSLCASKMNQQIIDVPSGVESSIEECKEFTTNIANITRVTGWIEHRSEELVTKASSLVKSAVVFGELNKTVSRVGNLRSLLNTIFGGVTPPTKLDVSQEITIMFLQALIDVKTDIENLEAALINADKATPSPSKA